jgi:hypothetical protein
MFAEDRAEALRELLLTDPATDPADRAARGRRMLGEVRTMRSLGETPGKRLVYGRFVDVDVDVDDDDDVDDVDDDDDRDECSHHTIG